MKKFIIILVFSIVGTILFQGFAEKKREVRNNTELYFLPEGKYFKMAVKGFEELAADIYWIKAVLYFGSKAEDRDYPIISSLLKDKKNVDEKTKKEFEKISKKLLLLELRPEKFKIGVNFNQ